MMKNFWKVIRTALLVVALPAIALAHAGGRDIRGTIVRFDRRVVVVKRVDGTSETVPLASTTTYRIGASPGEWKSMHAGSRVVVHIGHDGKAIEIHLPAPR
jgi:hypothetical protein